MLEKLPSLAQLVYLSDCTRCGQVDVGEKGVDDLWAFPEGSEVAPPPIREVGLEAGVRDSRAGLLRSGLGARQVKLGRCEAD